MSESMDAAGRLADDSVWAEIERLTAENKHLRTDIQTANDAWDAASIENERLTAALVEIRDYPEGEDGRLDSMEAIAREALATTEQEREL